MKRFASFLTAALAGSLVSAAPVAQADSTMYLVPISDINATYAPGAKVTFAAVIGLGTGAFGSFTVPAAVAYLTTALGMRDQPPSTTRPKTRLNPEAAPCCGILMRRLLT